LSYQNETLHPAGIPGLPRMNLWVKFSACGGVSLFFDEFVSNVQLGFSLLELFNNQPGY
jgi:hypothetical protein